MRISSRFSHFGIRRSQEFVLGGTVLDLSNFSYGQVEAQRRRWGWIVGREPLPTEEGAWGGRGTPENFLVFDLKMVNVGVF